MYTHNRESVATRRTAPIVAFSLRTADERFVASMGRSGMGRREWWGHTG
jgi:hypothetical protein